ncbi:MAG: glycerol-3-phosphate acyltransferase [Archangiaceae bacterium]|nr:glycerol-3-phosphate acyltransferase [Archangiaceae bacterium]
MSLLLIALGYFAGSIPFGVILTRYLAGKDVRASGSGNIGATNVARVAGKKLGAVVLVLDAAKGALPVLLAMRLLPGEYRLHAFVGLAAFLGHVFPIWLRLHGGKGVATAAGVLGVLVPMAALAGLVVFVVLVLIFRVASVGSLAGAVTALGVSFFLGKPVEYPVLGAVLLGLMVFTHRGNIGRLLTRRENKV